MLDFALKRDARSGSQEHLPLLAFRSSLARSLISCSKHVATEFHPVHIGGVGAFLGSNIHDLGFRNAVTRLNQM